MLGQDAKAIGPQADLLGRFFGETYSTGPRSFAKRRGRLKDQRRLADPDHHRSGRAVPHHPRPARDRIRRSARESARPPLLRSAERLRARDASPNRGDGPGCRRSSIVSIIEFHALRTAAKEGGLDAPHCWQMNVVLTLATCPTFQGRSPIYGRDAMGRPRGRPNQQIPMYFPS